MNKNTLTPLSVQEGKTLLDAKGSMRAFGAGLAKTDCHLATREVTSF